MGRLEDIAERNKHPRRHGRRGVTMGILLALFVFVILVLIVFTDFDDSPVQPEAAPPPPSDEKRVEGVMLYRAPAAVRDAGTGSN